VQTSRGTYLLRGYLAPAPSTGSVKPFVIAHARFTAR